ncbi:MAG: transketolase family protein [Gaiella sp.]
MRERFQRVALTALREDPRVALVLADIGVGQLAAAAGWTSLPSRVVNVGIREQLMIGVAAGLALEGLRPVVHTYAPFLVERPFEQIKLDLSHQGVGAVLVSIGASYDASAEGRTHQAPGDVALLGTLPDWTIHVPGHPDEAEEILTRAIAGDGRVYVRLSVEENAVAHHGPGLRVLRAGTPGCPLVVALGPALDAVLDATRDRDVTVAYTTTARPLDGPGLRSVATGEEVVLVEPLLAGTSSAAVADALSDRPLRLLALGIRDVELRRYGTPADHRAAHGLDGPGIRRSLDAFLGTAA